MAATASLAVRVSAQIAEFQKAFADTDKTVKKFADNFEGAATRAAAIGTFLGNVFTKLASAIVSGIGNAISEAVRLSSEFNNAFLGLGSVAAAFGQDVVKVKDAAKSLSADGLLPLKDSATGLKNLLSAGFNLEQSVQLMNAFKDSAAFGRQGALSFGDAVRSATEGVKNGNSILVDNAGVTKNLSQILVEAGFSAQDLSKASSNAAVRMALFNGILKETRAQLGDAEKLTRTYTGAITKLETAYDTFLAMLGDAVTQNETLAVAIGTVSEAFISLTGNFKSQQTLLNLVSDGVIFLVKAFATLINAVDLVQTAFAGLQIVSNTFLQGFVSLAQAIVAGAGKLASVMQFLDPVGASRHAAAAREAEEAYNFLAGAITGFDRASIDAQKRSDALGNSLQGARAKLLDLATNLTETRGKLIELGGTRPPLDRTGDSAGKANEAIKTFGKSLEKLTSQIQIADAGGSSFAELVELFGKAAAAAVPKADAFGLSVAKLVRDVATGFNLKKANEELAEFRREVEKTNAETREDIRLRGVEKIEADAVKLAASVDALADARDRLADVGKSGLGLELAQIERKRRAELAAIEATRVGDSALTAERVRLANEYYNHLVSVATGSNATIVERMRAQGVFTRADLAVTTAEAVRDYNQMRASGLFTAEEIQRAFERMNAALRAEGKDVKIDWAERFKKLRDELRAVAEDTGRGIAELIGDGIKTGDWSQFENNLKDVLSNGIGAAAAAAVNLVAPGLGTILQPIFTALGDKLLGFLGLGTRGRDLVKDFAESFGGFDALREKLRSLGAEGERMWIALTQGVGRNNPDQAKAAIDAITKALEDSAKGLTNFITGAKTRIDAFAQAFKDMVRGDELKELRELINGEAFEDTMGADELAARKQAFGFLNALGGGVEEVQEEFSRLGLFAGTAFAQSLKENGLAQAIKDVGPLFDQLTEIGEEFGFTLEGSAAQFAAFYQAAKDNADVVQALEGLTLMIEGASDALFITQELFSAFSTDAVAQFTRLTERGISANQAMAFMQPTLQALWEAQQRFGFETDKATQALIDQAVQQGIVGANMRDVNQKILDVLIAIADVFGAVIPDALRNTAAAAQEAASDIEDALAGINVPPIDIPFTWEMPEGDIPFRWRDHMVPALAHGGIVRSPTLALIGEAGPEAVVPLDRLGSMGSSTTVILEVDGRAFAEVVVPYLPGEVTRYGVGLT